MTALAPSCCACCRHRSSACSRVFSQRLVRMVMLPPTSVCKPAPIVPTIDRERTMIPRTTPSVLTIRWPLSSKPVVVVAAFMSFYSGIAAAAQNRPLLVRAGFVWVAMLELIELALHPGQVLHVVKGDVDHVADNENGAGGLHDLEHPDIDRLAPHTFHQSKGDVPAIEHWNRQHIQNRQVDAQDDAEPQGELPAVLALKQHVIDAGDPEWAAHM